MPTIREELPGFAVVTNSDLTEGRGASITLASCTSHVTAKRLARRKGVQGLNADVLPIKIYNIDGVMYAPAFIQRPNAEDQLVIDRELRREEAKKRLEDLGVSAEELTVLIQDLAG